MDIKPFFLLWKLICILLAPRKFGSLGCVKDCLVIAPNVLLSYEFWSVIID